MIGLGLGPITRSCSIAKERPSQLFMPWSIHWTNWPLALQTVFEWASAARSSVRRMETQDGLQSRKPAQSPSRTSNPPIPMKQDQASRTAKFVSNGIYWVSRQPELAVEVPPVLRLYTDAMTEQINPGQLLGSSELEQFILLKQSQVLQAASVPGIYLHQVLRKRCIESLTRAVVNTGIQQVVIIGAGYDTLSLRLSSEQPRLTVIELDHPATQRVKRDAISRFHLDIGASSFFPVDLSSQGLEAALCACPEFKAI